MTYTAGEAAKKLGLTKDGLRYYEKEGLLPQIARDLSGHRAYTDADMEWIYLIRCLRDTDMSIFKIRQYVSLLMQGGRDSIPDRRRILLEHQQNIQEKVNTYAAPNAWKLTTGRASTCGPFWREAACCT